jgi:argininosuccinate lyase
MATAKKTAKKAAPGRSRKAGIAKANTKAGAKPAASAGKGSSSRTWGGRFASGPAAHAQAFTASIGFDIRLAPYDIRASIAHANMLGATGIIPRSDARKIVAGLKAVRKELDEGSFVPTVADEDIHMAVERRLIEKIGAAGARLHSARSRNDQVITDVRLFVKDAIDASIAGVENLQKTIVATARKHGDAILPGYTHLQRAQPVALGHHLLAWYDMLERDRTRLVDCRVRVDVLGLGAGAIAGTTLPIDREMVARELGFARVAENSMDAVADRDFIVEYLACVATLFMHLSRVASEITLWVGSEFGFAELHDAYSTGSSMMPQKKNPDIAELVRGKSGRAYGNLLSVLVAAKGLPLTYNSDLQEDKEPLFDSVDTTLGSLELLAALLDSLRWRTDRMRAAAGDSMLLATDLAELLVDRGVPFRKAHEITGALVGECLRRGIELTDLSDEELTGHAPELTGALRILTPEQAVNRRRATGGTAMANVRRRLARLARKHGLESGR